MCTVSVVRINAAAGGCGAGSGHTGEDAALLRIACNRDESRSRVPARPPELRQFGERQAILPVDPISDGTWVAVNDAGLAMTLLNIYSADRADRTHNTDGAAQESRGTIIPNLLRHAALSAAFDEACRLNARRFPPFRLLIIDGTSVASIRSNGRMVRAGQRTVDDGPLLYTSSGLGDELVDAPRRALFSQLFAEPGDLMLRQSEFHRHSWPDRPHISVCMRRTEAHTVSHTVIEVRRDRVTLLYHAAAPDEPAEDVILTLNRCSFA